MNQYYHNIYTTKKHNNQIEQTMRWR